MATKQQPVPKQSEKGENAAIKVYLVAYNVSQMLGWTALMIIMVNHFLTEKKVDDLYPKVEKLLQICQTAAVLEIVHALTGLVRSNWLLTAFQVYSRVFLVWGVVWSVPETQQGPAVAMWLSAWTVTEIIRYSFYFCSLLPSAVPYSLVWMRYTFFIILYPIGVSGELLSIFTALPTVKASHMYSLDLPNVYNISFHYYYYLCFIVVSYLPVFPQLYLHMFRQRKKVIGGRAMDKKDNWAVRGLVFRLQPAFDEALDKILGKKNETLKVEREEDDENNEVNVENQRDDDDDDDDDN